MQSLVLSFLMLISIIFITLLLLYALLIFYYRRSWVAIPSYNCQSSSELTFLSVIIPARNEENNIGHLLSSIYAQTYPTHLFEVIVIDDHSTDGTVAVVRKYPGVKLVTLDDVPINSYKKKAIETGIAMARGELVITTDADCIPTPRWLETIACFHVETGARFIVAPVNMISDRSFVTIFQAIDFMVLQGITGGSVDKKFHAMCNGANLAYEKKLFMEVDGFKGIDHIASGDDMLLMHKVAAKYPEAIGYLKSEHAIVNTKPADTWAAFLNQRIRWASKATSYKDNRMFFVLLLVYLVNTIFLVTLAAGFWHPFYWLLMLAGLLIKTVVEWPFIISLSKFFSQQSKIAYFFPFQPIHILYIVASGLFGQFGRYEWKGRKVN